MAGQLCGLWLCVGLIVCIHFQNLSWKLGQQTAICWNSIGLFKDYGLNHICSWNKTFFVSQYKKLKLSALFRQFLFPFFLFVVWLSWNFVRFHGILFQIDADTFIFLSWKNKTVLFLKKYFLWYRQYQNKKRFVYRLNFQWRFCIAVHI